MEISNTRSGDVVILELSGRLTLSQGDELLRNTVQALVKEGHRRILLNFGGVSYTDSSGLGALISVHSALSRVGGRLKLSNLSERQKGLLALTRLNTIFETFDSTDAAVASFTPTASS